MKSVFGNFVKKEVFHIIRDYRSLIVLLGMPIAQVILFGFAIRLEIDSAPIAIYDMANGPESRKVIDKLTNSGYYELKSYIHSDKEIEKVFQSGEAAQVIVFPQNFGEKLEKEGRVDVQIINDASNPNTASLLNSYTANILLAYAREYNSIRGRPMPVNPEVKMLYNPELESSYMFVPGLISFILLLVSALMTSISIARENELGTMETLMASPLRPWLIVTGKVAPYVLLALINTATILVLALLIFQIPFEGSFGLFALETLLFILTSLALGIFISTVAKTMQAAMMASLAGLLMPSILLSGFIFPISNMPWILQTISHVIPSKWFLIILKGIMLKGLGIEYLWKETLIIAGMAAIFLFLGIANLKERLDG